MACLLSLAFAAVSLILCLVHATQLIFCRLSKNRCKDLCVSEGRKGGREEGRKVGRMASFRTHPRSTMSHHETHLREFLEQMPKLSDASSDYGDQTEIISYLAAAMEDETMEACALLEMIGGFFPEALEMSGGEKALKLVLDKGKSKTSRETSSSRSLTHKTSSASKTRGSSARAKREDREKRKAERAARVGSINKTDISDHKLDQVGSNLNSSRQDLSSVDETSSGSAAPQCKPLAMPISLGFDDLSLLPSNQRNAKNKEIVISTSDDGDQSALSSKQRRRAKRKGGDAAEEQGMNAASNTEQVVSGLVSAAQANVNELDDYSSAWKEVKRSGGVWGGRAKGGRGIQTSMYTGHTTDVCVNQVSEVK